MKSRLIKYGFWTSETVTSVSRPARFFLIGLWAVCDRNGVLYRDARRLRCLVFPFDEDLPNAEVEGWLEELEEAGILFSYEADGNPLCAITNWGVHGHPHKNEAVQYAPPPREKPDQKRAKAKPRRSQGTAKAQPRLRQGSDMAGSVSVSVGVSVSGNEEEMSTASPSTSLASQDPGQVAVNGTKPAPITRGDVELVFFHWRQLWSKPAITQLSDKRARKIKAALEIYGKANVIKALDGYHSSPFHQGDNERATVYDDIELHLRDPEHIERGIALAEAPPPMSDRERRERALMEQAFEFAQRGSDQEIH